MSGYGRPDVYITETLAQSSPSFFPGVTPGAFIGAALQGPIVPTLITSWVQFQRLYGGWTGTSADALALQVYQFFNNGGSACFVVRVLGAGAAIASLTLEDIEGTPAPILTLNADSAGAWGNLVFVEIVNTTVTGRFNLNVRLGAATNPPIERFTDLSMNPVDPRYAVNVINASSTGSSYIFATLPTNWVYNPTTGQPAASTIGSGGTALSGGSDSSAPPTLGGSGQIMSGLNALSQGQSGQVGLLINLVGVTDSATIDAALAYVTARNDSFLIIDPGFGENAAAVVTAKAAYTPSSFGAVYWPNIWIGDPSSPTPGSQRLISPSGSVMGQYAVTDATRGTTKAPAGVGTALAGVIALELPSPQPSDYDTIATGNVNGIRYFQNYGFVIWGSKTLKATAADSQVSVRRTLMAIENALYKTTLFAVEEDNDEDLWYEVSVQCGAILQQLFQQNGLAGSTPSAAYFVTCNATNNTPQTIAAGEVHVTVGVALQTPALFIIIQIGQYAGASASQAVLETL